MNGTVPGLGFITTAGNKGDFSESLVYLPRHDTLIVALFYCYGLDVPQRFVTSTADIGPVLSGKRPHGGRSSICTRFGSPLSLCVVTFLESSAGDVLVYIAGFCGPLCSLPDLV